MKKWYKSKSIWIGLLEVIGGTVAIVAGMAKEGTPVTAAGVIQIVLRLITRESIAK